MSAALAIAGCSGSSNTSDAGNPTDAGVDAGSGDAGYDPSCSSPGTVGNAQGVGKFCTPGGSQCNTNTVAIFCTATYDHTTNEWFCTRACNCDSDCGDNAICTGGNPDGGGDKGCVPLQCAGDQTGSPLCPLPDGGFLLPDGGTP